MTLTAQAGSGCGIMHGLLYNSTYYTWIILLNLQRGSTVQWGTERGLLFLTLLVYFMLR